MGMPPLRVCHGVLGHAEQRYDSTERASQKHSAERA
jgi:hypothetical protein